mmetsp:Transcript_13488/g.20441  ORF Transcript_13488/g.20441 Transcript_13488/m.20441 type:complete len:133 (-) Transcript_13488:316-714(-)
MVVTDSNIPTAPGQIGNVLVQVPDQAAYSYCDYRDETSSFDIKIEGMPGYWIATGDLGRIIEDKYFIIGRKDEMLRIPGDNFANPIDIERKARTTSSNLIRYGTVFAYQHSETENALLPNLNHHRRMMPESL